MLLPDLPAGLEWFTTEGEQVFPEFLPDGPTGRLFCYLMSQTGPQVFGIALEADSDIPEKIRIAVDQFQQTLQEKTNAATQH